MATAAQARLETALQRMLDLDCKLRRIGARVAQDDATLEALKAADKELQAASLGAPDTLLPPRLLTALQSALVGSCGRGGDTRARLLRCFTAAATVRALLQGFGDDQACTNQAGCRRQQIGHTPGMLQAQAECLRSWRDNLFIVEPVLVDLNRLMTCNEVCATALQVPHLLDALCQAGARSDGCNSLTPLYQLVMSGGPRVAVRAACEPGLLHAAARVAGGGSSTKAGAASGFLAVVVHELDRPKAGPRGPADSGESEVARENVAAATPAIADAAARGVLRFEVPNDGKGAVFLLETLLRADGTRPAAARAALAAGVLPALLRLMNHPESFEPAASCIAFLSRLEPGRAELMKTRPATFAVLAAALRRTAAAGASTPGAAASVVRAVAELVRGDKAAAAAFLDIALPGGVLPALAHHISRPDGGICHGSAEIAAALAEAAEAAGPQRLAAVAAAPGLLAAAAAAIVRAMTSSVSAPLLVRFHALDEISTMDCDEAIMPTVGDLIEGLDRLTAVGAAAVEAIVGVEGLEAALAAVAAEPAAWARMDATAAAARVLGRLRGAAAAEAPAGEARGQPGLAAACAACGRTQAEEGVRLRLCRGCRAVRYCSEACARKDWVEGIHKQACKPVKGR